MITHPILHIQRVLTVQRNLILPHLHVVQALVCELKYFAFCIQGMSLRTICVRLVHEFHIILCVCLHCVCMVAVVAIHVFTHIQDGNHML